ncbi:MAG TPA: alpha/beta fold hydrolase [Acidimicrobiales bacterium]
MPVAEANGIEICYEAFGDAGAPTMLLVPGLGSQMISFDRDLCERLAACGYHVVRFDNRDVGLSSRIDGHVDVRAVMRAAASGAAPAVPYLLSDMAADVVGLLDHLGVGRAHVVGVSMGGMIAQTVAVEHPQRLRSLTSIMSSTGDPDVGTPSSEASAALFGPPPRTRAAYQDAAVRHAAIWGSPGIYDEDRLRRIAGEAWDRGYDPHGTARQMAAILASGSRSAALAGIDVPTLVVHGTVDRLVHHSGGERTAAVVPGARLMLVDGMGHDLAPPLWPRLVDAVAAHAGPH